MLKTTGSGGIARSLGRLFGAGTLIGLGEGAMLDRFVRGNDAVAFEAIVGRHGPMVLGVCRRFLAEPSDVDDAFQATFLVLVRKAGSVRGEASLGPWLYGVAHKIASKARRRAVARGTAVLDREPADFRGGSPEAEGDRRERAAILHDEVARLPEIYRDPVVLCYLEGLSHDEAADRLGCPVGTVKGRLARARDRLRDRLARRGLDPAGVPAVLAFRREVVPPALAKLTVTKAAGLVGGASLKATAGAAVARLVEGAIGTMIWNQAKIPAALAALALVGLGGTYAAKGVAGPEAARPEARQAPAPRGDVPASRPDDPFARGDDPVRRPVPASLPPIPFDLSKTPDMKAAQDPFDDGETIAAASRLLDETLPKFDDADAPEKIRAVQADYDRDLAASTAQMADQRAKEELLAGEVEAIKQLLARMSARRIELEADFEDPSVVRSANPEKRKGDRKLEQETVDHLKRQSASLVERLGEAIGKHERARAATEAARRRLDDLKRRPRPVERLEAKIGDTLRVEVLEALPGRPINGERFIRPDGKISLDYYGEIYVHGMTTDEIKERVILRLRSKFLNDETLGLIEHRADDTVGLVAPRDSDRVFVDILRHGSERP